MPIKIKVLPGSEDRPRALGALWDEKEQTWFIPDIKRPEAFKEWLETGTSGFIIKTPFYIAMNTTRCCRCDTPTPVLSLASEHYLVPDHTAGADKTWSEVKEFTFFPFLRYVDDDFKALLRVVFPYFKSFEGQGRKEAYWANHCIHCGAVQEDDRLHTVPGVAFFPLTEAACRSISLVLIAPRFDLKIDASSAKSVVDIALYAKHCGLNKVHQLNGEGI